MKRLPLKAKRHIRSKTFSFNNVEEEAKSKWSRAMDIKFRITNVVSEHENWYEDQSPYNPKGKKILVNLKVSGKVVVGLWGETKEMREISKVAKYTLCGGSTLRRSNWGGWYNSSYDRLWGYQAHKRIRQEIRSKVRKEIKDYLKLLGICSERYWQDIEISKIII